MIPSVLLKILYCYGFIIRDVNGSDTDEYCRYCICFHIFLSGSDSNTDSLGYKYGFELLWLRIRIDMYRIRSEPDADHVGHECLFGYQVKETFFSK